MLLLCIQAIIIASAIQYSDLTLFEGDATYTYPPGFMALAWSVVGFTVVWMFGFGIYALARGFKEKGCTLEVSLALPIFLPAMSQSS